MKYLKYFRYRKCHSTTTLDLPNYEYISLNEYNLTRLINKKGISTPEILYKDIDEKKNEWACSNNHLNYIDNETSSDEEFYKSDSDSESDKKRIDLFRENHPVVIYVDEGVELFHPTKYWLQEWIEYLCICFQNCNGEKEKIKNINRNVSIGNQYIELADLI